MVEIQIDSGFRKVAVRNEENEVVTVLKINVADSRTIERFYAMQKKLHEVSERTDLLIKDIEKETDEDEAVRLASVSRIELINEIIAAIDALFGDGTVRNVYKECYASIPDFVPDEDMLNEFVGGIVPVMAGLFGERFAANRQKYSVNRRGANSE